MCKKVCDRIGANGFENFTSHPFFLPIDFDKLEKKQVLPVFVPSSEKTNFDATYDLEELLLEEAPLEARARHQKPRPKLKPDASDQEKRAAQLHEMIEEYFEPFDYTQATFEKYVHKLSSRPSMVLTFTVADCLAQLVKLLLLALREALPMSRMPSKALSAMTTFVTLLPEEDNSRNPTPGKVLHH